MPFKRAPNCATGPRRGGNDFTLRFPTAFRGRIRCLLEMVTRDVDRAELKGGGYLALPDGGGPHPGVVVIHEAYGLNDNIKDITRRFADSGYVGLAVDLFSDRNRALCMARYMAGMLIGSVHRAGIDDLKEALTHIAKQPEVDPDRVGAIGFCMGGGFAIAWACTDDRLKAIAPFYAANPRPLEVVQRLCPVVGSYPEKDFTASAGRALDQALDRRGVAHDIKIYPGTRHSFFSDNSRTYDKEAAADSWTRVLSFFGTHLAAEKES
jgi:carboxymethylenebutenolidase